MLRVWTARFNSKPGADLMSGAASPLVSVSDPAAVQHADRSVRMPRLSRVSYDRSLTAGRIFVVDAKYSQMKV